jgi:hypothetical protein
MVAMYVRAKLLQMIYQLVKNHLADFLIKVKFLQKKLQRPCALGRYCELCQLQLDGAEHLLQLGLRTHLYQFGA